MKPINVVLMNLFWLAMIYGLTTEAATLCAALLAGSIGYLLGRQMERRSHQ